VLREHRRERLELHFAAGQGRSPDDSWRRHLRTRKQPAASFHAFRHSHACALIAADLDVVRVGRRLGHGSPAFTRGVHSHLFDETDDRAAAAIDGVLGAI
jgi:integrase